MGHKTIQRTNERLEADLMEKVRQVGEHYELNKYKTLNKTIELDARLANERLLATKIRLNQVSSMNDKLMRQLRSLQQDFRSQEKKLLLTETMLRQLVDKKDSPSSGANLSSRAQRQPARSSSPIAKQPTAAGGRLSKFGRSQTVAPSASAAPNRAPLRPPAVANNDPQVCATADAASGPASGNQQTNIGSGGGGGSGSIDSRRQVNSSATQTQTAPSKTRTIINDLRQRLNLVGNSSKG